METWSVACAISVPNDVPVMIGTLEMNCKIGLSLIDPNIDVALRNRSTRCFRKNVCVKADAEQEMKMGDQQDRPYS